MSALRPPGLGPIIGHTTHDSCRLWIQAGDPEDRPGVLVSNRRTVGVIGLIENGKVTKGYYFRLQREFDRTGTFVIGKDVALGRHESDGIPKAQQDKPLSLKPDTAYVVRMGTLSVDDPLPDDESLSDSDLVKRLPDIKNIAPLLLEDLTPEQSEVTFRTFPVDTRTAASLSFLLGSCRYPGLLWKVKQADQIFDPMVGHLEGKAGDPARFTVMVGDQVYADTLTRFVPIGLADTYEEFQERYKTAFGSPNMRRLLRAAPTYMTLDDHEIEDNWTQDRLGEEGKHRLFNIAIGAYMSYQWSHGPRSYGRLLYYRFDCAGYPFFVLDTRTHRFTQDSDRVDDPEEVGLRNNHLLGRPTIDPNPNQPGQLKRLLDWLRDEQLARGDAPKFIASSSVFAPNDMSERINRKPPIDEQALFGVNLRGREDSDSWPAYPQTRRAILDHIVRNQIQNVVFLSGDIHCSNIARLRFVAADGADLGITTYDITSSAFYWPFPFADGDPNNYVHNSTKDDQLDPFPIADGGTMNYTAWGFTQEDNFCRIEIDKPGKALRVGYYDRAGKLLKVADENGKLIDVNTLALAAWK